MKTSELTGAALDWAVAKCENLKTDKLMADGVVWLIDAQGYISRNFNPSANWSWGGPIIEREEISVEFGRAEFKTPWIAYKLVLPHEDNPEGGPTPLIAAMRCYVASKLGDDVDVPEVLQ